MIKMEYKTKTACNSYRKVNSFGKSMLSCAVPDDIVKQGSIGSVAVDVPSGLQVIVLMKPVIMLVIRIADC